MREPRLRRYARSLGLLLAVAACGGGPVPIITNTLIGPSAFREGGPVLFAANVDPNGTTVRPIEIDLGRRSNVESPVLVQERIQAFIQFEDLDRVYTEPGTGWDLHAVITYRRDGETADRTAFGATVTQLTP